MEITLTKRQAKSLRKIARSKGETDAETLRQAIELGLALLELATLFEQGVKNGDFKLSKVRR